MQDIPIYRIVHKQNLDFILKSSKLCSSLHSDHDPNFIPIGESSLIRHRSMKNIVIQGIDHGKLAEYIPFYFGVRPPMLYAIQHGFDVPKVAPSDIAYIVGSMRKLQEHHCRFIFTDGHAYNALTQFHENETELGNLDWEVIHARNWRNTTSDPDRKRRKQAECLVHHEMPLEAVASFGVYSNASREYLNGLLQTYPHSNFSVNLEPDWYY